MLVEIEPSTRQKPVVLSWITTVPPTLDDEDELLGADDEELLGGAEEELLEGADEELLGGAEDELLDGGVLDELEPHAAAVSCAPFLPTPAYCASLSFRHCGATGSYA